LLKLKKAESWKKNRPTEIEYLSSLI